MRTSKTFKRLATVASAVTVAGVIVPVALATSASAAAPTSLAVTPSSQYVAAGTAGGTAAYTVSLTPSNSTAPNGVSFNVASGPDANTAMPFMGTGCTAVGTGATYTCTVPYSGTAGTDSIHFYAPATAGGTYQTSDPMVNGTLVIGGTATSYTITPTSSRISTGSCAAYTVSAKDANGNPASGNLTVNLTQTTTNTAPAATTAADPMVRTCDPTSSTFPATSTSTPPNETAANPPPSTTTNTYTAAGTYAFPTTSGTTTPTTPGSVVIGVASNIAGTVNISAGTFTAATTTAPAINPATATLTVDAGNTSDTASQTNDNNASSLTVSPKTASTFPGATVNETAIVDNASGDPLGGVRVVYEITSGPDMTAANTPVACGVTNGFGVATCTYTATTPSGSTGSDAFVAYVNQTTPANPTLNADQGEPKDTATISISNPTVTGGPNTKNLTSTCDAPTACQLPTTTGAEPVTFTLVDDSGNPIAGASVSTGMVTNTGPGTAGVLTPAGAQTTNAQGQVTFTLTTAAPVNGQKEQFTATVPGFNGGPASTDVATVSYATAGAVTKLTLEPYTNSAAVGGTTTVTAVAVDGFGNPVSGVSIQFSVQGRNTTANNMGATGTATTGANGTATFTYTDNGSALVAGTTVDTITASTTGTNVQMATADVNYYTDNTAKTVGLGIVQAAAMTPGTCVANQPATFSTTTSAENAAFQTVCITVANAAGTSLNGKAVTVSTSGVGTFVTATGTTITSTSETVPVDDGVPNTGSRTAGAQMGYAKVYVRSASAGTETITATADATSASGTVMYNNSEFQSITPERVLDTRSGQGGIAGPLAQNTNYAFDLSNTNIPTNASAYVFNVTAIMPSSSGNLRFAPATETGNASQTPSTSLLNYTKGKTIANAIVVPNDEAIAATTGANPTPATDGFGEFTLYSDGASVNVAIDITGYYISGSTAFNGLANGPARIADTRNGTAIASNASQSFTIPTGDVPAGSKAVAINVTAISPTTVGNLRVYPDGSKVPTTSNINYIPGTTKAAFVVVNLPADGKIDLYSDGSPVNVAIDLFGYYSNTSKIATSVPTRVFDSRTTSELQSNVARNITVTGTGVGDVPADAQAVLISLTGIHAKDSTGVGNLRVFPAGAGVPTVSTLNYVSKTADVANFAIVPIGTNGQITLYSNGSNINATVDILGYVPAGS